MTVHDQSASFAAWPEIRLVPLMKDLWKRMAQHHVGLIAAGVAFYALLALFPAITAVIAIGGLIFEPSQILSQIDELSALMPREVSEIIIAQAQAVAGSREGGLGLAAVIGIVLALYSASRGMSSLIEGLNVVFAERETRGFFELKAVTFGLTITLILGFLLAVSGTLIVPIIVAVVPMVAGIEVIILALTWLVMLTIAISGLSLVYRFAPDRKNARWSFLTIGSAAACLVWVIASGGFAFYVGNFGSYNESFGSLAGAIVLLMWLWISAFVVMMGAEVNAAIVQQRGLQDAP